MKTKLFSVVLLLSLFASVAEAGGLKEALKAALKGPQDKGIKLYDHGFNVKPVERIKDGDKLTVSGHMSHKLRWRPDDQIYYIIRKEKGVIKKVEIKFNRGGLAPIAAPFVSALGAYLGGVTVPPDEVEKVGRKLGALVDGKWETACQILIAEIAIRVE